MKTALTGTLAFAVGVGVVMTFCKTQRSADRTGFLSDVVLPTHSIIGDINNTIGAGNHALADRKLKLLDTKLWEYRQGGDAPEVFVSEIAALK